MRRKKKNTDYILFFSMAAVVIIMLIISQGRNLVSLSWNKTEADVINVSVTSYPVNTETGTHAEHQTILTAKYKVNAETYTKEIIKSNYRYRGSSGKISIRVNPSDPEDIELNTISWPLIVLFAFLAGMFFVGGIVNLIEYRKQKR